MAFDELEPVNEEHLLIALKYLRDLRAWSVTKNINPWVIRQAVITFMAIDTEAALERGIEPDALLKFDELAEEKAVEFIESIPKDVKDQVLQGVP